MGTATVTIGWTNIIQPGGKFPMTCGYEPGMRQATATVTIPVPDGTTPSVNALTAIAESIFEGTNLYAGPVWAAIEPALPPFDDLWGARYNAAGGAYVPVAEGHRDHTALSVGDTVTFEGITLACASIGWTEVPA